MSTFGNDRYYTSAGDIFSVLRTLQSDRSSINIQFDQSSAPFSSMVLNIDLHAREFYLDEFASEQARKWAASGRPFSLRASINGIRVHARDLVVLETVATSHAQDAYRVAFPERLMYLQRRDAYRAVVPATLNVVAKIQRHHQNKDSEQTAVEKFDARIVDMSATGLALEIDGRFKTEPRMMELLSLDADLPMVEQHLQINTHLVYTRYQPETDKTLCGMKFSDLPRNQQLIITRFVTQLQREGISKKIN